MPSTQLIYTPWQRVFKEAVRDGEQLCRLLGLPLSYAAAAQGAARAFSVCVPRGFLKRICPGDPDDPLLNQVLPREEELVEQSGFTADPVGDTSAAIAPGLLRKYAGRVLMVTTGACAVHCRYCFRRHFSGGVGPSLANWELALARIEADQSVEEVILSGGDPLALADEFLSGLAQRLAEIGHLRRLRIHTRLPIAIPERVDDALLAWLRGTRLATVVVIHANHPAEIDEAVAEALTRLVDAGLPVLNQAVLLRGVNDNLAALEGLCRRLIDLRVIPYYLHQLDRVAGATHFEVPEATGIGLIEALRTRLPGYAVPRYVREVAGQEHKVVLA
ncbi:MAG: EF-P beta-lysylation protein EpmB [Pirellulales bacterium]